MSEQVKGSTAMTHDELVEKVARANWKELAGWADRPRATWGVLADAYRAQARAAIAVITEALAEPTEEMVEAGLDAPLTSLGNGQYEDAKPGDVWQAMLAASPLAEGRE